MLFPFSKKNVEMSVDARANKPDGIVSRERENLKNVKMKFWWSSGKCQIAVQKNVEKYMKRVLPSDLKNLSYYYY